MYNIKKLFKFSLSSLLLFILSFLLSKSAYAQLSCDLTYATTYLGGNSEVISYDPLAAPVVGPTSIGITLPGSTRASALSPDGDLIVYYDDSQTRIEWYRVSTGATGFGTNAPSAYISGGNQINRMGYAKDGRLFILAKNNVTGGQDLLEVDTTTFAVTVIGPLINSIYNPIGTIPSSNVNSLAGGDILFDDANKGYVIDNNGSFFKFDMTTLVATYMADIPGVDSSVSPAGLAYTSTADIFTFTSASGEVYWIDLPGIGDVPTLFGNNTKIFADAFSCAYPDVAPKPSSEKGFSRVVGADANGLNGTLETVNTLSPGDIVEYQVVLQNSGLTPYTGSEFQDTLPAGTTYVANSTTLNGTTVAGATFPYETPVLIQGYNSTIPGVVNPDDTPAIITDNEVVITYRVRIDDPFALVPREISNQGTFTFEGEPDVVTCDPTKSGCVATVVPVFSDMDGDGIPDYIDLDSDGDGLLDSYECGYQDSGIDGPISSTNLSFGISSSNPGDWLVAHNLDSLTIFGTTYSEFVVPDALSLNFDVATPGSLRVSENDVFLADYAVDANFTDIAFPSFQDRNLNYYMRLDAHDFTNDSMTLTYGTPIVSAQGKFLAITERSGNNPYFIEAYDTNNNLVGSLNVDVSAYINTEHRVSSGPAQATNPLNKVWLAAFPVDDLAPVGTPIAKLVISFTSVATTDGPDGKVFFFGEIGCDNDGDGIPNNLDIDSDNDGIIDALEGNDANGDGIADITPTGVDTDGDGIDDAFDADNGGTPLGDLNTDGDAMPNYLDLDSDNDGIPDNIESQPTVGYIAPSGVDSDGNGLDDAYESVPGAGEGTTPINTDLADTVDYLDLDSDNEGGNDTVEAGITLTGTDSDLDGLDDATDATPDYSDPNGTINDPTTLPNTQDPLTAEVDYREITPLDAVDDIGSTTEDTTTTINWVGNDSVPVDGFLSTYDTTSVNGGTVVDNGDGTFDYTPAIGFAGTDTFTYTICDTATPTPNCDTATVTITVTDQGNPDAVDDSGSTTEDIPTTVNWDANDSLIDGAVLNTYDTTSANGGTVVDNGDGTFDYTPATGFAGTDTFTYTVCDDDTPTASCDTATVTITVADEGNPDAIDDTGSTTEDIPTTVNWDANDSLIDGAVLNAYDTTSVNGGTVVDNGDGTFDYTPATGFAGTDTFTYTVCDDDTPTASCDTATVTITVTDEGNPDAVDDAETTIEDTPVNVGWSTNDTLIDSAVLTSYDNTSANGGTVVDNGDGTFTYTPASGFSGTDTFTYTVCDDDSPTPSCDTATITITVLLDTDGDGIPDVDDIDDDNDGILDVTEGDGSVDTDGDGIPDSLDLDSDGDGVPDSTEGHDANQDGIPDVTPLGIDTDGDGLDDAYDPDQGGTPEAVQDTDGDSIPDYRDLDSDGDGIPDAIEAFDANQDGVADVLPTGLDTDGDGIDDAYDTDNGGINPISQDTDGDGHPDYLDIDSDGDGILDSVEVGSDPLNPVDTDGDGIPDYLDLDSDNDGVPDYIEGHDANQDGIADVLPTGIDTDGDGLDDAYDPDNGGTTAPTQDTDGDGIPDYLDIDSDGDGIPDATEAFDANQDGVADVLPTGLDTDGDGLDDAYDPDNGGTTPISQDTDGDGHPDYLDIDSDGDGIMDSVEVGTDPLNPVDTDGDGTPDYLDLDSDNDGIPDSIEGHDANQDGLADVLPSGFDTNGDGLDDAYDPDNGGALAPTQDTDGDGIPDYQDIDSDGD